MKYLSILFGVNCFLLVLSGCKMVKPGDPNSSLRYADLKAARFATCWEYPKVLSEEKFTKATDFFNAGLKKKSFFGNGEKWQAAQLNTCTSEKETVDYRLVNTVKEYHISRRESDAGRETVCVHNENTNKTKCESTGEPLLKFETKTTITGNTRIISVTDGSVLWQYAWKITEDDSNTSPKSLYRTSRKKSNNDELIQNIVFGRSDKEDQIGCFVLGGYCAVGRIARESKDIAKLAGKNIKNAVEDAAMNVFDNFLDIIFSGGKPYKPKELEKPFPEPKSIPAMVKRLGKHIAEKLPLA